MAPRIWRPEGYCFYPPRCANGKASLNMIKTLLFLPISNAKMNHMFSKLRRVVCRPSITERAPSGRYPEDDGGGFIVGVQFHWCYFDMSKISQVKLANCEWLLVLAVTIQQARANLSKTFYLWFYMDKHMYLINPNMSSKFWHL